MNNGRGERWVGELGLGLSLGARRERLQRKVAARVCAGDPRAGRGESASARPQRTAGPRAGRKREISAAEAGSREGLPTRAALRAGWAPRAPGSAQGAGARGPRESRRGAAGCGRRAGGRARGEESARAARAPALPAARPPRPPPARPPPARTGCRPPPLLIAPALHGACPARELPAAACSALPPEDGSHLFLVGSDLTGECARHFLLAGRNGGRSIHAPQTR